jgi:hypothetical protein
VANGALELIGRYAEPRRTERLDARP